VRAFISYFLFSRDSYLQDGYSVSNSISEVVLKVNREIYILIIPLEDIQAIIEI